MATGSFGLCSCWFPKAGPLYWDFRCLKCGGVIHGPVARWRRRRKLRV